LAQALFLQLLFYTPFAQAILNPLPNNRHDMQAYGICLVK
jgi:hypothetical protein